MRRPCANSDVADFDWLRHVLDVAWRFRMVQKEQRHFSQYRTFWRRFRALQAASLGIPQPQVAAIPAGARSDQKRNTAQRENERPMLLVTGGAGFIGSNVVADLNEAGYTDVAVNDTLGSAGKWRNLQKRQLADFVAPA